MIAILILAGLGLLVVERSPETIDPVYRGSKLPYRNDARRTSGAERYEQLCSSVPGFKQWADDRFLNTRGLELTSLITQWSADPYLMEEAFHQYQRMRRAPEVES